MNSKDLGQWSSNTAPLAELLEVSQRYGATQALNNVTFNILQGESVALVGRNGAGKSTAVKALTGLIKPQTGQVKFDGLVAPELSKRDQWRKRVSCVYQKSTILKNLSVCENLFLNDLASSNGGFINWKLKHEEGERILNEWELSIDLTGSAANLKAGQKQMLEIARALRLGTNFIILDEPTAQLEGKEIDQLFKNIDRLQKNGVTFLYISHHLKEIYEVCNRVVVMRDGEVVANEYVATFDQESVISAMVGPEAKKTFVNIAPESFNTDNSISGEVPVLKVIDVKIDGLVNQVSFELFPGERVGIAGVGGCGKSELADALFGIRKRDGGTVSVLGKMLPPKRTDLSIKYGIGFVPEDRHANGFCSNLSVEENITLPVNGSISRGGFISRTKKVEKAEKIIEDLQIKVSSRHQLAGELSGGNQQKVVMGRALAANPNTLILVSPTAGVDIASKSALFETIKKQAAAVILVSDEIDELRLCNRVLIMFDGKIVSEFPAGWDEQDLLATMEGKNS